MKYRMKKNEEKWGGPERPVRHHQVNQYTYLGVPEERRRKGAERIFDEILSWKHPKFDETHYYTHAKISVHFRIIPTDLQIIVKTSFGSAFLALNYFFWIIFLSFGAYFFGNTIEFLKLYSFYTFSVAKKVFCCVKL